MPSKTANNLKYSGSEEKLWQGVKHMWLSWRQPTSTGKKMVTRDSLMTMTSPKTFKRMKEKYPIFSFQSLMGPTPFMSSCSTSSSTGNTALGCREKGSQSIDKNYLLHSTSPLMKKGNTPSGSLMHWVTPPSMMPWKPTHWNMGIGESQLSSIATMTLPPTSQKQRQSSKHSEPTLMPCKQPRNNAVDASLGPTHTKTMPSSGTFKRALTSKMAGKASSHPSPTALVMV